MNVCCWSFQLLPLLPLSLSKTHMIIHMLRPASPSQTSWRSQVSPSFTAVMMLLCCHLLAIEVLEGKTHFQDNFVFFHQGSGFKLLLDKVKGVCYFFLHLMLSLVSGFQAVFDRAFEHGAKYAWLYKTIWWCGHIYNLLEDYGKKPNTFLFVKKYIFWEFPVSLCSMVGTQLKSLKLNKAANNKQLTPIF